MIALFVLFEVLHFSREQFLQFVHFLIELLRQCLFRYFLIRQYHFKGKI